LEGEEEEAAVEERGEKRRRGVAGARRRRRRISFFFVAPFCLSVMNGMQLGMVIFSIVSSFLDMASTVAKRE
jgi:hypothetical protein